MTNKPNLLDQIHGEQLSSVEFVQDYFQLRFDGPTINVYNPTSVKSGDRCVMSGDDQFRNMLCEQITKIVKNVEIVEKDALTIDFKDDSQIKMSLKDEDYRGPEAAYCHGFKSNGFIVL